MGSRIDELIRDLRSEKDDVRRVAVIWLSQLSDPGVLPHLQGMTNDPCPSIRFIARRAVGDLAKPRESVTLAEERAIDTGRLLQRINDPDLHLRVRAALVCYHRREPELLPALLKRLSFENEPRVIATLVKAIGMQGDPTAISALMKWLSHPDSRVRANTIEALAFYEDEKVLEAVSALAGDSDNRVSANVAIFLAQRNPEKVRQIIRDMLASKLVWKMSSAIHALGEIGAPWCSEELERIAQLEAGNPLIMKEVKKALLATRKKLTPS